MNPSARVFRRAVAAQAWSFRHAVELEAMERFARLAGALERLGAPPSLVAQARRAADDERRHAALCAGLAEGYGAPPPRGPGPELRDIAPPGLELRGRVLYELVAASCIAETDSVGVLTALLHRVRDPTLRRVLRELARDEVGHSRLGWAHLAAEHGAGVTGFLSPLVPAMLRGHVEPGLFGPAPPGLDDDELPEHGVLPHALRRALFVRTMEDVVFPGLEAFGVGAGPARAWLAEQRRGEDEAGAAP